MENGGIDTEIEYVRRSLPIKGALWEDPPGEKHLVGKAVLLTYPTFIGLDIL